MRKREQWSSPKSDVTVRSPGNSAGSSDRRQPTSLTSEPHPQAITESSQKNQSEKKRKFDINMTH